MASPVVRSLSVVGRSRVARRSFSTGLSSCKQVTVLGASGGIGQPLSLLLKMNPLVTRLHLYDLIDMGVATDLQHCGGTKAVAAGFSAEQLKLALQGSDLVVIPAGVPPRPGMSSDEVFNVNASIVSNLTNAIAENCPAALVAVISNPINSMVPIVSGVMKQWGVYDPRKVFGVTTLNLERANYMIGLETGVPSDKISCPVIGGHADESIIPLFSRCDAARSLNSVQMTKITENIRNCNDTVTAAKGGKGGPTLSMAYSAGRFCNSLLLALGGHKNLVECTYVRTDLTAEDEKNIAAVTETAYFSTPVVLGQGGIVKNLGLGKMTDYEKSLLPAATRQLKYDIKRGEDYVKRSGVYDEAAKLREEMEKRN